MRRSRRSRWGRRDCARQAAIASTPPRSSGNQDAARPNRSSAALKGSQVYGPYGKRYDHNGTIGTSKGFTEQYNDALTGLDDYGARYYDNVVGLFLSADSLQGNPSGMNPYAYVEDNPETYSDPTGQLIISVVGVGGGGSSGQPSTGATQQNAQVSSTDPCLIQSCGSTVLANTGSIWATNSTLGATACLALAPCIHVSVPTTTYHLVDTFTPLTYCTMGCGEEGDENSLEAESEQKAEIIANEIKAFEAASPGDAGTPASNQVIPDSDNPAPESVMEKAAEVAAKQYSFGKGFKKPTVGGVVITDSEGNVVKSLGPFVGHDPVEYHAETQAFNFARNWLSNNAVPGENYSVNFITEQRPCPGFCSIQLDEGFWSYNLSQAAQLRGANADLSVWWHRDWGELQLFYIG